MMLDDLVPVEGAPRILFDAPSPRAAAAKAGMGWPNLGGGRNTVSAATGRARGWELWAEHRSPCSMTRLTEVLVA